MYIKNDNAAQLARYWALQKPVWTVELLEKPKIKVKSELIFGPKDRFEKEFVDDPDYSRHETLPKFRMD